MLPFMVMVSLFIFDFIIVFLYVYYAMQWVDMALWISKKKEELLTVENSENLIISINDKLQLFYSWIVQIKNIIIPGIIITQLLTAYIIDSLLDDIPIYSIIIYIAAWTQAGVVVAFYELLQRIVKVGYIMNIINEEFIQLTVIKEAEKIIEDEKNNVNGE